MSQARSSAVHLQIRLLLFLCLLILLVLAGSRIYETTTLSEKINSQNLLLTSQQEALEELQAKLNNTQQSQISADELEQIYTSVEESISQVENSLEPEVDAPEPLASTNQLPTSLNPNSVLGDDGMENLTSEYSEMLNPQRFTPPPLSPLEQQEQIIEDQLSREQHIGLVAAVNNEMVAIEPLEGMVLFDNDKVLVAREIAGVRKLIGTLIISSRREQSEEGKQNIVYIADVVADDQNPVQQIAKNDLVFHLGTSR